MLAQAVLAAPGDEAARMEQLYLALCGRAPEPREAAVLQAALREQRAIYAADPALAAGLLKQGEKPPPPGADAVELAAWTGVAQLVMNSDGFLWKR